MIESSPVEIFGSSLLINSSWSIINSFALINRFLELWKWTESSLKEYQKGWAIAKNTTDRNLQIIEGFESDK